MKSFNQKASTAFAIYRSLIAVLICLGLWGCKTYHPMEEANQALQGSDTVDVSEDSRGIYFQPNTPATTGFIFYPGAGVKPGAYAPMALSLAEAGFTSAIAKFPLNLAVLAANRADAIRAQLAGVERWVIGGHSLGGVMAAQYLDENREDGDLEGLILMAAYPSNSNDISDLELPVLSLYASEDQLTKPQDVLNTQDLLPTNSAFIEIPGGNHAQFGWYGPQDGDGAALISRQDQAQLILDQVLLLLSLL